MDREADAGIGDPHLGIDAGINGRTVGREPVQEGSSHLAGSLLSASQCRGCGTTFPLRMIRVEGFDYRAHAGDGPLGGLLPC